MSPTTCSRTAPPRERRARSGVTSPDTTASPRPQVPSITRSSDPSTGLRVKSTPAQSGAIMRCTTTATRGSPATPSLRR
ncbi:MAG: hypothetical protein M5U28_53680 [Sandaracinaceae bacterium]|nr:hypothetical protein [Sandaracinaceae bacterium]